MTTSTLHTPIQLASNTQLEPITATDQDELYALMRRIYTAAYAHLWMDGADQYLKELYLTDNFYQEINDPFSLYYFVRHEAERVGILRLLRHQSVDGKYEERSTKLQRIYLASEVQGKGMGKQLISWCTSRFLQNFGDRIWLEVMRSEIRALNFYQKMGFEQVRAFEFEGELMYPHLRGMYIMQKVKA